MTASGVRWLMLCLMHVVVLGCASAPQRDSEDPLAGVPSDFTLTLNVLRGETDAMNGAGDRAASRWVLFPDGSLCYEHVTGAKAAVDSLPPLARVLNRAQVAGVWSQVRQLGLLAYDAGEPARNMKLIAAEAGEIVHVADVRANGVRRTIVQRTPIEGDGPALAQLAAQLGELSWADEVGGAPRRVAPKRYDFGPDPYARYRR